MADVQTLQRGPVTAVVKRTYSKQIPADLVARLAAAALTVDDRDSDVSCLRNGRKLAVVWGPSVQDYWFCYCEGDGEAVRVQTRDDGLRRILGDDVPAVTG